MHERATSPTSTVLFPEAMERVCDGFPRIDWNTWLSINPSIVGWITIPHTTIDHPIVLAPKDDPNYYLDHDIYNKFNIYGAIFLDASCSDEGLLTQNALIYGHHMNDGSMFADIASYGDESYAKAHQTILIQTPNWKQKFNCDFVNIIDANTVTAKTKFGSWKEFIAQYEQNRSKATVVLTNNEPTHNITLCTCSYTTYRNERTLVVASCPQP